MLQFQNVTRMILLILITTENGINDYFNNLIIEAQNGLRQFQGNKDKFNGEAHPDPWNLWTSITIWHRMTLIET